MKVSEIVNEGMFNSIRQWYIKQPRAQKQRAKALAKGSFKKWAIQLDRLQKGGVNFSDLRMMQHQLGQWATRFFKSDQPIVVSFDNVKNADTIKKFITQLVYKKLAGVNLNDAGYANPNPQQQAQTQTQQPTNATPAQPNVQHSQQQQTSGAPIGSVVKANAGKYIRTANGWMTEKNQQVTNPKSIQWLEQQYIAQQNKRTP